MSKNEHNIVVKAGKPKLKSPKPVKPKAVRKPSIVSAASPKLSVATSTTAKETLYVDVDDEITAIIERVKGAKGGIIALVLPKRATVLQSIVNMRLLKRAAEAEKKNLVLVTSETSLLPLAGLVGMHVAETPSSKPVIPPRPDIPSDEPESVDEPLLAVGSGASSDEDFNVDAAGATPIGELAGMEPLPVDSSEEIIIDDSADPLTQSDSERPSVTPVKKNKKLAVPNFDVFRLRIVLVVLGVIALIFGWVFATKVLPRATVTIQTNSQVIKSSLNLTFDTAAKQLDEENRIVPATAQTQQKSYTQQVPATGQLNKGEKASGKVLLTNCSASGNSITVPTGTSISSNGMTYITQASAVLDTSAFTSGGACKSLSDTSASVTVTALKPGISYNVGASTFTLSISNVTAKSSTAFSGGTDEIVKVVAQADIDAAKAKITAQDTAQLKQDMEAALRAKSVLPIPSTFLAGEQQVTASANPGETADTVTVTAVVPYTMLGINQLDLQTLVIANVNDHIDTKKQKILENGIAKAVFTQQTPGSATNAVVGVRVESVAGPELAVEDLKKQVAGKKANDIKQTIGALPGVTDVQVSYGPFWVSAAPKDVTKITITIGKPTTK
jgi:hypothetical protein